MNIEWILIVILYGTVIVVLKIYINTNVESI